MARKREKPKAGRPTLEGEIGGGESKRVSVRLTDAHIATAEELGQGSVSAGVRAAIEVAGTARLDGARRKSSRTRGGVA
jgi:hypothetical protein